MDKNKSQIHESFLLKDNNARIILIGQHCKVEEWKQLNEKLIELDPTFSIIKEYNLKYVLVYSSKLRLLKMAINNIKDFPHINIIGVRINGKFIDNVENISTTPLQRAINIIKLLTQY